MKVLIFSKFSTDLMNQIYDLIDKSLKWVIVSSFETNCQEWKDCFKDATILSTKNVKSFDCQNVILDSVLDQEKVNLFKDVKNLIVITQKPKFFTRSTFTDVYISSSKNSKKLIQYHEFCKFPYVTFEEFNKILKSCKFLYINPMGVLFKRQLLHEEEPKMKENENKKPIQQIKDEENKKVIQNKENITKNSHTTKLSFQVQVSSLLKTKDVCNDIQKMSLEPIISKMYSNFTYEIKDQSIFGSFDVRKKRFDLFGILLLNIIRALKQESKITQGSVIV